MIPFSFQATHKFLKLGMDGTVIAASREDALGMVRDRIVQSHRTISVPHGVVGDAVGKHLTRETVEEVFTIDLGPITSPRLETVGITFSHRFG
jgi:hypothetical protein